MAVVAVCPLAFRIVHHVFPPVYCVSNALVQATLGCLDVGRPENCFAGGGWHGRLAKEGGGGFQKRASVPGPLFCARTVVATKGAGTQILARKIFFTQKFSPTYV